VRIELLADHPHAVPEVAAWHYAEWGHLDPAGSLNSWTKGLRQRTRREGIPTTLLALDDEMPVGSASLVQHDMSTRADLTPWLAGVYVLPAYRRRGIGGALVRRAMGLAADLNFETLYLYSRSAMVFYRRLGWRVFDFEHYEGRKVAVMCARLDDGPGEPD
jgi:GNAT superfamily N-acetyltransferase